MTRLLLSAALVAVTLADPSRAADPWNTLPGGDGPGRGKHVVLVSGDEEYRSEETLTQLAKILSAHHGFKCTVLYAIDKETGVVNPNQNDNIPGLEALKTADLMVLFLRWRNLPDDQLKHVADYVAAGKPIVGIRTSTHAFKLPKSSGYAHWDWASKSPNWTGGFGREILGETWVAHHGAHGKEGTRGVIAKGLENHPVVRGIADGSIFGPTDVYRVKLPLPGDSTPVVFGQITQTMQPDSPPVAGPKNDPMMPLAWTKTYRTDDGKSGRVFTTTIGASEDFAYEGTRRMLVNGCYWALGLESQLPEKAKVDLVGEFKPTKFGSHKGDYWKNRGLKPQDLMK